MSPQAGGDGIKNGTVLCVRGRAKDRRIWKDAVNALGHHRRAPAILVKVNQANIRGRIAQAIQDRIWILSATVVHNSSSQLDQPGRARKQTQKTPHFFFNANANHRNRLTEVKAFSGGCARGIFSRHRFHFAPCGGFACLLPGACSSNLLMSRNGTGTFGAAGIGVSTCTGSTMCGVTNTSSSVLFLLIDLERNSCPSIGISPMPGTLLNCVVARRSNNPAIPDDWPTSYSISLCSPLFDH